MNTPTHNDVSIPGNVQPGVQQILPFYHDCCYAQVLLIHLCYKRMSSNVQRYQTHFIFVGTKSSAHVSINCKRMCKTFLVRLKYFIQIQLESIHRKCYEFSLVSNISALTSAAIQGI